MKRGTPRHRKMRQLAAELNVPLYSAVGIMEMLWHYTAQECPQGNIGIAEDREIAAACLWTKNPESFVNVLVNVGWLDRDPIHRLLVHDWSEHADNSVHKWLQRSGKRFIVGGDPEDTSRPTPTIYFIQDEQTRRIKIGFTEGRLEPRLSTLQTGCPGKLNVIGVMNGSRWEESKLHKQFASYAVCGEWFEPVGELTDFISSRTRLPNCDTSAAEVMPKIDPPAHACAGLAWLSDTQTEYPESLSSGASHRKALDEKFAEFWSVVWLKVGKDAARDVWRRKVRSADMADRVIAAAKHQGPRLLSEAASGDRTPVHPRTWLSQGRYEDELPAIQPSLLGVPIVNEPETRKTAEQWRGDAEFFRGIGREDDAQRCEQRAEEIEGEEIVGMKASEVQWR